MTRYLISFDDGTMIVNRLIDRPPDQIDPGKNHPDRPAAKANRNDARQQERVPQSVS